MSKLDDKSLDQIFREAHTFNSFTDAPVSDDDIRAIYELAKFGPTAANTSPARFLWVRSAEAKEKLRPTLAAGNVDKTMKAPATVIVAADYEFYEQLPKLFPHADARSWYVGNDASIDATAKQSGSLQAAYLIIAARALGFDCGPMGGFNAGAVDEAFLAGTKWKSSLLINVGHGAAGGSFPRNPRMAFEDAVRIL